MLQSMGLQRVEYNLVTELNSTGFEVTSFPCGSVVNNPRLHRRSLSLEDPLEEQMATYFSILAW